MLRLVAIGALGNMLSPAARHLAKNNNIACFVRIYDRKRPGKDRQERRQNWLDHGAVIVGSYKELIGSDDIDGVVICAGKNGDDLPMIATLIKEIRQNYAAENRPFILHLSTVSVDFVENAYAACQDHHITYANYPLTGGVKGANEATMLILASGEEPLYDRLEPLLLLLGKPKYFDAQIATAAKVKLIGHLMVYNGLLGMASAITMQNKAINLSASKQTEFFDFLNQGSGGTRQWDVTFKQAIAHDAWHSGFLLPHAVIDAIYTANLLINNKLPAPSIMSILNVACTFSFILANEGADRLATQAILEVFIRNPNELDLYIEGRQDFNAQKYLDNIIHSLSEKLQKKVRLDVSKDEFEHDYTFLISAL